MRGQKSEGSLMEGEVKRMRDEHESKPVHSTNFSGAQLNLGWRQHPTGCQKKRVSVVLCKQLTY